MDESKTPSMSATEALLLDLLGDGERFGLELVATSDGRVKRGSVYVTLTPHGSQGLRRIASGRTARRRDRPAPPLVQGQRLRRHRAAGLSIAAAGHQPAAGRGTVMRARAPRPPALRGRWMAAASRRLFSPESFSLLVEPAIADLQIENSGRLAERDRRLPHGVDRHGRRVRRRRRAPRARLRARQRAGDARPAWCSCTRRTPRGWWCCCSDSTGACIWDGCSRPASPRSRRPVSWRPRAWWRCTRARTLVMRLLLEARAVAASSVVRVVE